MWGSVLECGGRSRKVLGEVWESVLGCGVGVEKCMWGGVGKCWWMMWESLLECEEGRLKGRGVGGVGKCFEVWG